jgi:putative endonuclease
MVLKDKIRIGSIGEKLAANHIKKQGFKVLDRNFKRLPWGEIDIVAKRRGVLFFFEVKTTGGSDVDRFPEQKINRKKKVALGRVIQVYLSEKGLPLDSFWQVDAIIVRINFHNQKYKIKHLHNIFY